MIQRRVGFHSIPSAWSHLGLKHEGFVGSEDEQKTHFPSWLHLPLWISVAVVVRSGRQKWSNIKETERHSHREGTRGVGSAEENILWSYCKENMREPRGHWCDRGRALQNKTNADTCFKSLIVVFALFRACRLCWTDCSLFTNTCTLNSNKHGCLKLQMS